MVGTIGTTVLHLAARWFPSLAPHIETEVGRLFMSKVVAVPAADSLLSSIPHSAGHVMKAVVVVNFFLQEEGISAAYIPYWLRAISGKAMCDCSTFL